MNRRFQMLVFLLVSIPVFLSVLSSPAEAQQTRKMALIGYLDYGAAIDRDEAFFQALRDLGWIEGRNIAIEYRWAEGRLDRLPALAKELVGLKVDLIVTGSRPAVDAAKSATTTIPIVMVRAADAVENRLVASLARPGGNITGLSSLSPEISGKQLELLKEIVPRLSRVAVLGNSTEPGNTQSLKEMEHAAGAFSVQLQYLDVRGPKDIEVAFNAASKGRADAVLMLSSPVLISHRKQIVDLAVKSRLPGIYPWPEFVQDGGLITYSVSITDLFRRAATYVDKILKGAKPAELPVEQPTKFELVINLKTAKQIGLTVPPNVLARADRVIR